MPTIDDDTITIGVRADTSQFTSAIRAMSREADAFSGAITRAFKGAIAGGRSFESVLSRLALQLAGMTFDRAFAPLSNWIGSGIASLFSAFGLAKGGTVAGGRILPFARGGVVGGPTLFPLARGVGLMGERGAEAVLPLKRGPDGALGVGTSAAAPVVVNFNVTAADAESFAKSEAQLTAMLARAVARGRRGL
jgi:phage-related minor tail protein